MRYGMLYPQYLVASMTYLTAISLPGASYQNGFPVLHPPPFGVGPEGITLNILMHLTSFFNAFGSVWFLLIFVPLYFMFDGKKNTLFLILFFQAIGTLLGYSLSLWWLSKIEAYRFSLIPFVFFVLIGGVYLVRILRRFFRHTSHWTPVSFTILFLLISYHGTQNGIASNHQRYYESKIIRSALKETYDWIKTHAGKHDLVASQFPWNAFLFERPFVCLPLGKAFTDENLVSFIAIYKPEYIVTSDAEFTTFAKRLGFVEKKRSGPFMVLTQDLANNE